MLSEEEKARIRAEEEFRKAIQQQLAQQDPPSTKWQRVFSFLNTNVGGWLLSTVLVGTAGLAVTEIHNQWNEAARKAAETRQRSHQEADMVTRLLPSLAKAGDEPEHLIAISVVGHLATKGGIDSALVETLQPVIERIAKKGAVSTASAQERQAAETVTASLDAAARAQTTQQSGNTVATQTESKPLNGSQQGQKPKAGLFTGTLPKRIYFHIANEEQRKGAEELRNVFRDKDFLLPGIENVGEKSPTQSEVRFFNDADQTTAEYINQQLREAGVSVPDNPKRPRFAARLGHFEIWLAK